MPSSQSPSLITEYSSTFTSLLAGKRELIQWGADAVQLNRFVIDAAESTAVSDPQAVLQSIDLGKVSHGATEDEKIAYCTEALNDLISLQEQVSVLQKSARESGISAGLLTIVGQAASQSPDDNGASILRQLGELVGDEQSTEKTNSGVDDPAGDQTIDKPAAPEKSVVQLQDSGKLVKDTVAQDIELDEVAANDIDRLDLDRMTAFQQLGVTVREHWRPLLMDASVCVVATGIAISLIN